MYKITCGIWNHGSRAVGIFSQWPPLMPPMSCLIFQSLTMLAADTE